MAKHDEAKALLDAFAEMQRQAQGAALVRKTLLKQLATSAAADHAFATAFERGRWTDADTDAVAEALLACIDEQHARWLNAYDEDEAPQHAFDGFEYDDLQRLYGELGRALVREVTGRDEPGSTAAERREGFTDDEVDHMVNVERAHAREAAQVEYWAQRDEQERKRVRRADTRYWDVATWPEAQQARELVDAQRGVTRTWVKKTETGYRIVWAGPAFLVGDEVRHAERGDIGRVDDYKSDYYAVTWLDGKRGAYRANELERF